MQLISSGMVIEPLVELKPAGVTRFRAYQGMDLWDFVEHAAVSQGILVEGCIRTWVSGCRGSLAFMMKRYLEEVASKTAGRNIAYGSFMLLAPLSMALGLTGGVLDSPVELAREASSIVDGCTGVEESRLHVKILATLRPSHLGRYEGPLPDVGADSGGSKLGFPALLRMASWDHVHREIVSGYKLSLEAYGIISREVGRGAGFEEAVALALLSLLARYGDTLIYQKYGGMAYRLSIMEARHTLERARNVGVELAVSELARSWRSRGWNPGAIYDIIAVAIGFYMIDRWG